MNTTTENRFSNSFHSYVCDGDTITAELDGFTITATIVRDDDSSIDNDDCHNVDQSVTGCDDAQQAKLLSARKAWQNDEWWYVGVRLSVSKNGIQIEDDAASLWSIECNYPDSDNRYLTDVANELLPEAIETAGKSLASMLERLTK